MSEKLAVIAVHGMGETKSDFADDLQSGLEERLQPSEHATLYFDFAHIPHNQPVVSEKVTITVADPKKK